MRIINEPTAAALAYGLDKKMRGDQVEKISKKISKKIFNFRIFSFSTLAVVLSMFPCCLLLRVPCLKLNQPLAIHIWEGRILIICLLSTLDK